MGVAGPFANNVGSEVKIFGDFQVKMLPLGLIVGHMWRASCGHMHCSLSKHVVQCCVLLVDAQHYAVHWLSQYDTT